jgi:hypothetical protein
MFSFNTKNLLKRTFFNRSTIIRQLASKENNSGTYSKGDSINSTQSSTTNLNTKESANQANVKSTNQWIQNPQQNSQQQNNQEWSQNKDINLNKNQDNSEIYGSRADKNYASNFSTTGSMYAGGPSPVTDPQIDKNYTDTGKSGFGTMGGSLGVHNDFGMATKFGFGENNQDMQRNNPYTAAGSESSRVSKEHGKVSTRLSNSKYDSNSRVQSASGFGSTGSEFGSFDDQSEGFESGTRSRKDKSAKNNEDFNDKNNRI